jgi:phosphatidylserine/phosphatidylglycerophosphate/cardiolipin synthase-like enzyme
VTDETPPRDLGERIRRIASSFGSEDKEASASDESLFDTAARSLGATIERWGRNPSLRRFLGGVQRDVLTSQDEYVELSANLGVSAKLGTCVRFYLDDAVADEVSISDGGEVRTMIRAPEPGLYRVGAKICNDRGETVSDLIGHRVLQVASGRPVVLVDAALILPGATDFSRPEEPLLDLLRSLVDEGFEIAYFDVHEKNRDALLTQEVRKQRLPPGAVLTYSAEEEELRSLGVDFVKMFATTAIRRLRAKGVPVTTILTGRDDDSEQTAMEQLDVVSPATMLSRFAAGDLGAEDQQAEQMLRDRERSTPLDWRLDQTTDSHLVRGNAFHAELDNHQARLRVLDAIDQARSSIHIQLYIVRPSNFAEELIVKLIQRARSGVAVRFMVDALYSEQEIFGRVNPLILSLQQEEGIEVIAVDPIESRREVGVSSLKKRDHRKLMIIDGQRAFVSGRNASDEYYLGFDEVAVHDHTRHERIPWLDAHVEVRGPLVHEVQRTFLETWQEHGGSAPESPDVLPPLEPTGSAAGRLVVHHGLADTNGLSMYESMFDVAEDHVYIVNDFPIVPALERAILRLLTRGVSVKLLTGSATARREDGSFFPAPLHRTVFEYMVKAKLEPLLQAGVEIYEFVPPPSPLVVARGGRVRPYVHAKIVSVDGIAVSIGSANLDATASFWESESNIVVQNEAFAREIEAQLQTLIDGSVVLDPESEYWKRERAQRAVVTTLWPGSLYS